MELDSRHDVIVIGVSPLKEASDTGFKRVLGLKAHRALGKSYIGTQEGGIACATWVFDNGCI